MAAPYIYLIHILIVFPLLFYLGYNITYDRKMNKEFGILLIFLSFFILAYHLYRLYVVTMIDKK